MSVSRILRPILAAGVSVSALIAGGVRRRRARCDRNGRRHRAEAGRGHPGCADRDLGVLAGRPDAQPDRRRPGPDDPGPEHDLHQDELHVRTRSRFAASAPRRSRRRPIRPWRWPSTTRPSSATASSSRNSTTCSGSRCCAGRRARSMAATPRRAWSTSSRAKPKFTLRGQALGRRRPTTTPPASKGWSTSRWSRTRWPCASPAPGPSATATPSTRSPASRSTAATCGRRGSSLRFTPNDRIDANLIWEHFEEDDDRLRSGKQLCHKDVGRRRSVDGPT